MGIRKLSKIPLFWVAICLMVCAGASELAMAQWASAYAEAALGLSKALGDLLGPCMFAVTMGICRVIYGKYGEKLNLMRFMLGSGALCVYPKNNQNSKFHTPVFWHHFLPILLSD